MSSGPLTPAVRPPRRRWRRLLAWLAVAMAALLLLLLGLWLFRQQLLVPYIRPRLEAWLTRELGAERVGIGAIGGNWFATVELQDVVVEATSGPLRELRGGRITLQHDLMTVLDGDLAGLRRARVEVQQASLDLRPAGASPTEASADWPDLAPFEPLLRLFPDGLELRVDQLRLIAPQRERSGELLLSLRPAAAAAPRELSITFDGLGAEVRLPASLMALAAAEPARITVAVTDPGSWFDAFAPALGVSGGTLRATLSSNWPPTAVAVQVELEDLVHADRTLQRSRIDARLDDGRLRVQLATIDLPGLALELREFVLARPFAGDGSWRRELAGRFALRIDDLTPHAALLPEPVRALLPIRGELAGAVDRGMLQLAPSSLQGAGVSLTLAQGSLPLVVDDWRAAEAELRFQLVLQDFALTLPELGAGVFAGRIDGELAGSVAAPRLSADLALATCRTERGSCDGFTGRFQADRSALALTAGKVTGLVLPWLGAAPIRLDLDARCGLRDGAVDADDLAVTLAADSELPAELLAPLMAANDLGAPPTGSFALRAALRHGANGITVERCTLASASSSPLLVAIEATGALPLRWSGGSELTALADGELAVQVRLERAAATPPWSFAGNAELGARSLSLRELAARLGPGTVTGSARIDAGLSALLDGSDLGARSLTVALDLAELELQQLPAAWSAPLSLRGRLAANLRAAGPWRQLAPELQLELDDGELHDGTAPLLDGVQLRVALAADHDAARALRGRVELAALVPATGELRRLGLGPELSFDGTVTCDDRGTVLEPTVLRLGSGELSLDLSSDLRRTDLLAGTFAAATTNLTGAIGLRAFALELLPPAWLTFGDCKGLVDGELRIGGTFADAGPGWLRGGTLSLRDGELKLDGVPRLEQLVCRLEADERVVTLHSLTGLLGAGRFTAHGSLTQPRSLVADPFASAAVALQLVGDDLLLFRGDGARVRASVRADASGTPDRVLLSGEVVLGRGSKYVRRISILPDLNRRGGKAAEDGLRLPALPAGIGERLQFDLAVRTASPFEVRANVFEGDLDVAARLRGTGSAPRLEGTMATRNGMFRFPGANLRLTAGLVTFLADEPRYPTLAVQAEGKRMGITVSMSVTGRYDRPEVQLSSVPPLPPQDLIVLLTTGQLPATLAAQGAEGQARFVGSYLAKEVFESYLGSDSTERGAGMFDRLTIEAGREVSRNGTESVLIEYSLTPRLAVQAERDAFEDYNLGLVLRFRFR